MTRPSRRITRTISWALGLAIGAINTPGSAGPPAPAQKPDECVKQCLASACAGKPVTCKTSIPTIKQCQQQCQVVGGAEQTPVSTSSQDECVSQCGTLWPANRFGPSACVTACNINVRPGTTVIWLGR
jgi:hypothetical protein